MIPNSHSSVRCRNVGEQGLVSWRRQFGVVCVIICCGVLSLLGLASPADGAEKGISFQKRTDDLSIQIDGQDVARFVFRDAKVPRPYFADVKTRSGLQVTRNHPPVAGMDATDHEGLHPGMWLSFGDLSGHDYWRLKARTVHEQFLKKPQVRDGRGSFVVSNKYYSTDGSVVIAVERCEYTIENHPQGWMLWIDSEFSPVNEPIVFGDQEEMGFGVRVATGLAVDQKKGGRLVDDARRVNGKEIWGKTVKFCDYAGPLSGSWAGITVCAGADNFRPAWAHARDYGFVALNPFGRQAFTRGQPSAVSVPKGETMSLRFGVVIHESKTEAEYDPAVAFRTWQALPHSQVLFRSRQGDYHTYRIPSLLVTAKGSLLAFCEGRKTNANDEGDIDLLVRRSDDLGRTWSAPRVVYEEGGEARTTIGNPCAVLDRETGTIWLTLCRNNDRVLVLSSTDDGATWSPPRDITDDVKSRDWGWFATGPGHGIQLQRGKHKGRLVIPCDCGFSPKLMKQTQHSLAIFSDDHGKTWHRGEPTEAPMDECQVAELTDGTLLLSMRNYAGKGQRALSKSTDSGQTWSSPMHNAELPCPTCQAGLIDLVLDGKPVLVYCGPAGPDRAQVGLRVSADLGATWSQNALIKSGPGAYSDLAVLPDGSIGILFEAGETSAYETLTFVRLGSDWLIRATASRH